MSKKHVLKVLKENLDWQNYTDGNDSWDDELKEAVTEAIKLLEQHPSDCKIFGTKENCFSGATEYECNHCYYKVQTLEQQSYDEDVRKVVDYLLTPKSKSISEDCVSRQAVDQNIYDYAESNGLSYANLKSAILDVPPVTPIISKGITNGDMIISLFGNPAKDGKAGILYKFKYRNGKPMFSTYFDFEWWNSPYKER